MANKLCECGCGEPAPIAPFTWKRRGWVKGESTRFCKGHNPLRHGAAQEGKKTPEYRAYADAKQRCTNRNRQGWHNYGGRGIKFLFTSFEEFLAEIGLRPNPKFTLDRRDNNSHYMVGNIHWVPWSEQLRNRRPKRRRNDG